jgi:hypothetical protein
MRELSTNQGIGAVNRVLAIESVIKAMPENLGEDPFPLIHHFAAGAYMREILIPKDACLVGKRHRHQHFLIFLSGDVTIVSEEEKERLSGAAQVRVSPIGAKRAFYAHEETRIITVHVTDKVDLAEIEAECIVREYEEIMAVDVLDEVTE